MNKILLRFTKIGTILETLYLYEVRGLLDQTKCESCQDLDNKIKI